jgi:hypothetical protein
MVKALVQRYNSKEDMYAIEKFACSDFPYRAPDNDFDMLIVIPTLRANTHLALIADTVSGQYKPAKKRYWPSKRREGRVRIDVKNVKYCDLNIVREELERAGLNWSGHWHVKTLLIEENNL